ncbi:MAG: hypothetical protein AAFZ01_10660 [Pseudomonadota bacterium]
MLAWAIVALLSFAGVSFVSAPQWALATLDHTTDGLPIAFGGRYLGLALAIAVFAWMRDVRALGVIALAGALMAAIDVFGYVSLGAPIALIAPHAAAFVVTVVAAALCLSRTWQTA